MTQAEVVLRFEGVQKKIAEVVAHHISLHFSPQAGYVHESHGLLGASSQKQCLESDFKGKFVNHL